MSSSDRKSVRVNSDKFISYKLFDKDDRICDEGLAKYKDISKTGISVENRRSMEVGNTIELAIALTQEIVKAKGIVRNLNQIDDQTFHVGIEFIDITDEQLQNLSKEYPNLV